jgi:hypothetical protein
MSDQILSQSAYTGVINAPIDWVDIADWLLNPPEAEYHLRRKARHHLRASRRSSPGRVVRPQQSRDALVRRKYRNQSACHPPRLTRKV